MEIPEPQFKIGEQVRLIGTEYHRGAIMSQHYIITRGECGWAYRVAGATSGIGDWSENDCEKAD